MTIAGCEQDEPDGVRVPVFPSQTGAAASLLLLRCGPAAADAGDEKQGADFLGHALTAPLRPSFAPAT